MDDRDVARHWDENAPDWIAAVRAGYDDYRDAFNNPAFFALLGDVRGRRLLDVGCGEGYNTRKFADLGAKVTAVDISERMIAAAKEHELREPRGIDFHVTSGASLGMFPDASFDGVVSTMALMDMADYAGCVREVARVVRPGGLFQFSIAHPCTMTRRWRWLKDADGRKSGLVIGNYFCLEPDPPEKDVDEWFFGGAPGEVKAKARKFRIPRFFRTLSEYVNTLVAAGFVLERIVEPYPTEEAGRAHPNIADARMAPYFLILRTHRRETKGRS